MASKKLSQQEEFFQVLNLVATKKVKVRYCRTIKERLRPSTIEESLALPSKPKSPTKRKVDGAEFLTPENLAENLQLRGGVSLLKSYKNRKKIKMKTAAPSTAPCTKSLLSYLQHKAKDSDSSSVESDCESSTENGESARDDFKLKEMTVSMARLSPEKLDRISSRTVSLDSGGEDLKMKGFSDDSVISTKKNKRNLRDLIINLETEIDDKNEVESSECTVKSLDLSNDNLEVVEDKDVVMQMVEDFSLMSESDSEEEDSDEGGRVVVKTEPAEIIDEATRNSKAMVWFPGVEKQSSVKKENGIRDSIDQCESPTTSSIELARMDSEEVQSEFEMTSTHSDSTEETLEEMLQRLEKSSDQKYDGDSTVKIVSFAPVDDSRSDSDSLESSDTDFDTSSTEEFENPALASLVSRMRRESKIEKKKKSSFLLEGSQKCRILEKCDYWMKKEKSPTRKHYDSIILSEAKVGFTRLSRPSRDDVLKARKLLKINDVNIKSEDQGDDDNVVDQLEIDKPIELVKKKKVKKKRLLEKKRRKRVNGIDDYIRIMLENREKGNCPPAIEPSLPTSDSSTFSVDNVVCNDVDVSSEINSTSISRDTLDISLHAETENVAPNPEQEEDVFLQDPVTFSITTENEEPIEAFSSNRSGVNLETCTNSWEEGVCILEKVESPKKNVVYFEMSEQTTTEDTLEPDQLEPKDEEVENALGFKKYQCNKCGKEFGTKNGLDYHERTHSGISPFECDVCFKRFKSSSLCSRHKQIHSITKKYNCDVCLKSFAQKSNLSKHMDIHAGIKPYQCPTCPKAFTQKVHLECHIMTHTKDKPWKCLSCATRFSKKSSLIRHSQNVHDMGKDDHDKFILLDEVKFDQSFEEEDDDEKKLLDRVRQMRREKKRRGKFQTAFEVGETSEMELQELNVIPLAVGGDHKSIEVTNTVLDNLVQNDLNEVNEQFDVEVTYCEDIDILNVPNDTLFIMDSSFEATDKSPEDSTVGTAEEVVSAVTKAKSSDLEQDSEQIEDIQKFLEESKSGTDPASPGDNLVKYVSKHNIGEDEQITKKISLDVPEPSSDKKPKYRIPKSPRKSLSKLDRKTPHIPYKKESGLKIISLSENFSRNKVKNDLRSPKKHSFEQALNEALTIPSKKVDRFLERKLVNQSRIVQKPTKPVGRRISLSTDNVPKGKSDLVQSPEKLGKNTIVLSKPKTAFSSEFPIPKPDVIKRIIGQQQPPLSVQNSLDKKPVIKPLFKPVKPHVLDPKRIKLETTVPKLDTSSHKFQPPPVFSTSQLNSLSQSLKPVTGAKPAVPEQKASHAAASSQDLYNSLKADLFNNSSGLDLYSSAAVRGLPVPVPASSELQSTLTTISAYLNTTTSRPTQAVVEPIKRSESQGYYTSNRTTGLPDSSKPNWVKLDTTRGNHELTDIESTDVESEDDNPGNSKGQLPTFLPTNFPTFDSPCSSPRSLSGLSSASGINYGSSLSSFNSSYNPQPSGVSNIKHSGIKPTAVVSPSRPRMPVLPKPVPAAFAASPVRVEKVSVVTAFMCSVCGSEFNSRENLVTHEQTTHWRS